MLGDYLRFHSKESIDFIIKLVISIVMICFLGPITIGVKTEMPITLQTLIILFCSIAFGWQVGALSTLVYIVAGAIGLPVFSNGSSGLDVLLGPRSGFFFGFLFAAVITGFLAGLAPFRKPVAAIFLWFLGHAIILFLGYLRYAYFSESWKEELELVLVGGVIKSLVGALIIQLIIRFLKGRKGYYNRTT